MRRKLVADSSIAFSAMVGAAMLTAAPAAGQLQKIVAFTTDDDDPFGAYNTDAGVSVNAQAVVSTSNMRMTLFDRIMGNKDTIQIGDMDWPFTRVDTLTTFGPSRIFDPQTVYHPQSGRLWIVYSEHNLGFGSGANDVSALHIAVSRDPATFPTGGPLDTFDDTHWWYCTGSGQTGSPAGNGGTYFDLQDLAMDRYLDGVGLNPHAPYPHGGIPPCDPGSFVDKPHIAVDEQAAYITTTGEQTLGCPPPSDSIGQTLVIIPTMHGAGLSILEGDKPPGGSLTFIRLNDLPAQDFTERHYGVHEPYEQFDNAQFFVNAAPADANGVVRALRLGGLWFDDTGGRWWYSQRVVSTSTSTLEDMSFTDDDFWYSTDGDYLPTTPDMDWGPRLGGSFFASAVLAFDALNNAPRIFAVHHVKPINPLGDPNQWAVQWYVIDPHLNKFRTDAPSAEWRPQVIATGRIDSAGDRYHPVIGVTPQGVAHIQYTYSSSTVWPEIRRVQLTNDYTGIVGSEVTLQTGPNNPYEGELLGWADFADMQVDPESGGCPKFWSTHTLVHPVPEGPQLRDRRDVWLFEHQPQNCNNANLNGDGAVDIYDMALFNEYYAKGLRRVDMNGDGFTDALDAAIYLDAYAKSAK